VNVNRLTPARRLSALACAAVLLTGCGGEATPVDAAPELAEQLARVDQAVTTGDEVRIRDRVESLVDATERAREAGRLDDAQADRILAAADALLARVPEEPAPKPPTSPTPSPTSSPAPPPTPEEDDEQEEREGHEEHHEKEPKSEKPEPDKDKDKGEGHRD
jgi:hypothetical protein